MAILRGEQPRPTPGPASSGCGEYSFGQLQVRAVDHLAVEREHARIRPGGEPVADLLRPTDPLRRGREDAGDGLDLRGVDAELAPKAVARGGLGLGLEPGQVARVGP